MEIYQRRRASPTTVFLLHFPVLRLEELRDLQSGARPFCIQLPNQSWWTENSPDDLYRNCTNFWQKAPARSVQPYVCSGANAHQVASVLASRRSSNMLTIAFRPPVLQRVPP